MTTGPAAGTGRSAAVRAKADLLLPLLWDAGTVDGPGDVLAEVYRRYLVTMHMVLRASIPLMELAVENLRHPAPPAPDRAARAMVADYLVAHIGEEAGHDRLVLDDLRVLGVAPEDVLGRVPPVQVAQLVGAPYYWVHHHDPLLLLGYIAVLEARPPTTEEIARLREVTGLPASAFGMLGVHASADPLHRVELDQLLDTIDIDDRLFDQIGVAAMATALGCARGVARGRGQRRTDRPGDRADARVAFERDGGQRWRQRRASPSCSPIW